jgi:predicted ATPase
MLLKGRDSELRIIGEHVAEVAQGRGGMLLIDGPPGSGRTSLLEQASGIAGRAGVRVCAGEASHGDPPDAFAPLLAALGRGAPGEREFVVLADVQDALERATRSAPLVLTLDDLQWADAETLLALTTLPMRLAHAPILWILVAGPGRPVVRDLLALLEARGAARMALGALSDEAVAGVVSDILRADTGPIPPQLAACAAGEPFLLVELLEGLRDEGRIRVEHGRAVVDGEHLPHRLIESVRARLERLSEDARRAVRLASMPHAEQLDALMQRRPAALRRGIDEATRAGLLAEAGDPLAFRSDLLREAVLEALPSSFRPALIPA